MSDNINEFIVTFVDVTGATHQLTHRSADSKDDVLEKYGNQVVEGEFIDLEDKILSTQYIVSIKVAD
ncbi:hypothetical protein [Staphylococcus hominis]|uniref:hypothetical protein n=1 Tax=Staphylococcus hominis TaxID=1290 RepID=UPI0021D32648|nr:hypothetical protein [Staphylococcus hominis]UXR84398.1 hypothetical protein MUA53_10035 [Staphylococcus hominis]